MRRAIPLPSFLVLMIAMDRFSVYAPLPRTKARVHRFQAQASRSPETEIGTGAHGGSGRGEQVQHVQFRNPGAVNGGIRLVFTDDTDATSKSVWSTVPQGRSCRSRTAVGGAARSRPPA